MGGLIFAFEDVTDRLATRRAYNSLLSVQKEILDSLFDAVLIFGSNGRLKFYNQAYLKLWSAEELFLQKEPNISELIESQKPFFGNARKLERSENRYHQSYHRCHDQNLQPDARRQSLCRSTVVFLIGRFYYDYLQKNLIRSGRRRAGQGCPGFLVKNLTKKLFCAILEEDC